MTVMAVTCPMCGAVPTSRCRTKAGMSVAVAHAARRRAAARLAPVGRAWCESCHQAVPMSKPGRLDFHDKTEGRACRPAARRCGVATQPTARRHGKDRCVRARRCGEWPRALSRHRHPRAGQADLCEGLGREPCKDCGHAAFMHRKGRCYGWIYTDGG